MTTMEIFNGGLDASTGVFGGISAVLLVGATAFKAVA